MQLEGNMPTESPPERRGLSGKAGEGPKRTPKRRRQSLLLGLTVHKVSARQTPHPQPCPVTCVAVVGQWVSLRLLGSSE